VKGVFHRGKEQRDRIDQGAIQVEENSERAGFIHTAKVIAPGMESEWGAAPAATYVGVVMVDSRRDIRMTMTASATVRTSFNKLLDEIGTVDQVGIEERVAKFPDRGASRKKLQALGAQDSGVDGRPHHAGGGRTLRARSRPLCQKARRPSFDPDVPPVAAVCIYPFLVRPTLRAWLADTAIKVASVATAFPSGQSPLALRLEEVKTAVFRRSRRDRHG